MNRWQDESLVKQGRGSPTCFHLCLGPKLSAALCISDAADMARGRCRSRKVLEPGFLTSNPRSISTCSSLDPSVLTYSVRPIATPHGGYKDVLGREVLSMT